MYKNVDQIHAYLKKKLDEKRYEHTVGVAYTAMSLAMRYGYDLQKAEIAGLLHDCAKCIPDEKKLIKCQKYNISITEVERDNPHLLHAKLGAFIAINKFKVDDGDVISAILNHTTGRPNMTLLEKIIFVADYIEPHRNRAPRLNEIRMMAFVDLDEAVYMVLSDTLEYLKHSAGDIDKITEKTFEYYSVIHDSKNDLEKGE